MRNITDRQQQVLDCIRNHVRRFGFPPSRPEIARQLGLSHASTVDYHLTALMRKGWIALHADTPRGIQLLQDALPAVLAGDIPACEPILSGGHIVERVPTFFSKRFSPRPDYFFVVRDDSMNRLGLNKDDLAAIAAAPTAEDGQVIVARVDDQVSLKRYRRIDHRYVELQPESTNPEYERVRIDCSIRTFRIDGFMVGALIHAVRGDAECR